MKIKIRIRTPAGQAKGTEKKIKPFILGLRKVKHDTYVSPEDDEIVWAVEGDVRPLVKIQRNVALFDNIMGGMLNSKSVKKAMRDKLSDSDETNLKDMLLNQTTCELVKEATANEIVEGDKSWWQRVKEKFKKKEEGEYIEPEVQEIREAPVKEEDYSALFGFLEEKNGTQPQETTSSQEETSS